MPPGGESGRGVYKNSLYHTLTGRMKYRVFSSQGIPSSRTTSGMFAQDKRVSVLYLGSITRSKLNRSSVPPAEAHPRAWEGLRNPTNLIAILPDVIEVIS